MSQEVQPTSDWDEELMNATDHKVIIVCSSIQDASLLQRSQQWRHIADGAKTVGEGMWELKDGRRVQFNSLRGDINRILRQAQQAIVVIVYSADMAVNQRANLLASQLKYLQDQGLVKVLIVHMHEDISNLPTRPLLPPDGGPG